MTHCARILSYIFVFLIIASCGNNQNQADKLSSPSMEADKSSGQAYFNKGKEQENRKLIWSADLEFQVKKVDISTEKITALAEKFDGFISDMNLTQNSQRISNTITVRLPNAKFQGFVSSVKGQSIYMDRADISSEDVTEEFVDIEARLQAKREVRDRYIEILKTKTGSVKDIIEAEEAIRVITEEIEAKEGRLRYLNDRVDLSTVTITLYEKVKFTNSPERFEKGYSDEVGESFGIGWDAIKSLLLGFITIWPLFLVGLITLGVWKRNRIKGWFKRV